MNDKTLCADLGYQVMRMREQHHITQLELSNLVGVSRETISAFECGRRNNLSLYCKILAVFEELERSTN